MEKKSEGAVRIPAEGLDSFQADFSFLLGAGFADPEHVATHGAERVFIENNFDRLAPP